MADEKTKTFEGDVRFTWAEMDTQRFKTIQHCAAICLVLRRYANWDSGIVRGAFSFYARAVGIHKGTAWRQVQRLQRLKMLKILNCRPGRRVERPDWTEIQLFDCHGQPLSLRRRNVNGAQAHLYDCAGATNTTVNTPNSTTTGENEEQNPPFAAHEFGGIDRQRDSDAAGDMKAAYAYLRSLKYNDRAAKELSEMHSLSAIRAKVGEGRGINQRRPGTINNLLGWVREELRDSARIKNGLSKRPPTPLNQTAGAVNGAKSHLNDDPGGGGGKRPANRPGGASESAEDREKRILQHIDEDLARKRSASERYARPVSRIGDLK